MASATSSMAWHVARQPARREWQTDSRRRPCRACRARPLPRLARRRGRWPDRAATSASRMLPAARLGQMAQRRRLERHALRSEHPRQVLDDVPRRHLLEVELQAARQHRDRNLLRIGGGEDELDVLRRLFQRLQHGVEGVAGKLVHFVDHIDLEAAARRRVGRLFQQAGHVLDAAIRCGIQFDVVDEATAIDLRAGGTDAAGRRRDPGLAIERLGHDARDGGLADAARAGEQVGVMQPLLVERVRQRRTTCSCPTRVAKDLGRHLRAST